MREDNSATNAGAPGDKKASSHEALRAYTKAKLAIAGQLRALTEVLKKRGGESRCRECETLMVKLAEDRFTLSVLGQFKRGKSSLMNAIIGRDLLPTGVLPLTSAITVLKFGPTDRLVVRRERMAFPEIVPISELANFVTEKGNPGNCKHVKTATVEVPLPFLRRGLEFVDTPGVGSSIVANTSTTYGFLPECDAALFVTSVDTPLTTVELDFLRTVRQYVGKIFVVVNKIDLIRKESELAQVISFVSEAICREMKAESVKVLGVSSRNGLEALQRHDEVGYWRSGMGELEEMLSSFLSGEKATLFLRSIIDKGVRLLDEESGELGLYEKARSLSSPALEQIVEVVKVRFVEHAELRTRLFGELERRVIGCLDDFSTKAMEDSVLQDYKAYSALLSRLPRRGKWLPAKFLLRRIGNDLFRRTQFQLRRWLNKHLAALNLSADPEIVTVWTKIQTDIGRLPALAREPFNLPAAQTSSQGPEPFDIELISERFLMLKGTWALPVPTGLAWLPWKAVEPWAQKHWNDQEEHFVGTISSQVRPFLVDLGSYSVSRLRNATEAVTTEIESRVLAAITGERPPRPASQQGCAPLEELGWGGTALEAIRTNLAALRDQLTHFRDAEPPMLDEVPIPSEIAHRRPPRKIEGEIAKEMKSRGCPVCNQVVDAAYNFFIQWQHTLATDEKARKEFADSLGFCPLHTWQLSAVSSPLGGSVGFAKFAQHLSHLLIEGLSRESPEDVLKQFASGNDECRVCLQLHTTETEYLDRFADFLRDEKGRGLYASSQGLCLRHLALLLPRFQDRTTKEFMLRTGARHFEETAEEMQNYAIKHQALRRSLLNADENDAWWRALTHISGAEQFCCPWPQDREI
jgi:GTP-binding protein EngB required for normal cell division